MKLGEINPFVRQAINSSLSKHMRYDIFNKIKGRDCRMFYIRSGKGEVVIEDRVYHIKTGSLILIQAGVEYIWQVEDIEYSAINFDYTQNHCHVKNNFHPIHSEMFSESEIIETAFFEDAKILNKPIVIDNGSVYAERIRTIVTEYYMGGEFSDELLSSVMKSVIVSIARAESVNQNGSEKKNQKIIRSVIDYIHENYKENISNTKIAEKYHFNCIYMNRIFKEYTGRNIHGFLVEYRLNIAMEILRTENVSVKDAAKLAGFSDFSHFSKTFKRYTGKTATEYRYDK